jgi:hypothetical protein
MKIDVFANHLQIRMEEELGKLNVDDLVSISLALTTIRKLLSELKSFVRQYTFFHAEEEIKFFKEIKPIFLSQYFYYKKVFEIKLFDSFNEPNKRKSNYTHQLRKLEQFATSNIEFYEYCFSSENYLDSQYFTRSKSSICSINRDDSFCTKSDRKLSKILANERMKEYLNSLMQKCNEPQSDAGTTLRWTGSKTDLVELIYALQSAEVFNNGSANIKAVAAAFQDNFGVQLGDFYRTFQEIQIRKKSPAVFIDKLKDKLVSRMESG